MIQITTANSLLVADGENCPNDSVLCPDGTYLSRDPNNNCEFPPCDGDTGECDKGLVECIDGVWVPRDPEADCEYVPCPGTERPVDDCPTDASPQYVKCCITGIVPEEMNGTYEGPVPCDHDPFKYCYYHVSSPIDENGNRKWFIIADFTVRKYQLKTLDNLSNNLVESKTQQNMSPCTPTQKGTYPFCVDWSGTGITAEDCSDPEGTPTPTPIYGATPTPTSFEPNYTPTSTSAKPPFQPGDSSKRGGGSGGGSGGGGTGGPGGGPWGRRRWSWWRMGWNLDRKMASWRKTRLAVEHLVSWWWM